MLKVVPAEGTILHRIVEMTPAAGRGGLSHQAFAKYDAALAKTAWAVRHRRRFALMQGENLLASAVLSDLSGQLDGQGVNICGIAPVLHCEADRDNPEKYVNDLLEPLLDRATQDGSGLALLFRSMSETWPVPHRFAPLPVNDVELTVSESSRHGAPMTLVRGGEDRDLQAIAAMGRARGDHFRFHLDRGVDLIKHVITRNRLLAGLGSAGSRQLDFVIAEEGITAAAYIVISVVGGSWMIEECGDRDESGARVGALLQALIAREPAESRPVIRGWLPPDFRPPQLKITSISAAPPLVFARPLSSRITPRDWSTTDVLYWRSDVL